MSMEPHPREQTAPNDQAGGERKHVPFLFDVADPRLLRELQHLRDLSDDWATRWIARCLGSESFRDRLGKRLVELRAQDGMELVRIEDVEETASGVSAKLVMEQRDLNS